MKKPIFLVVSEGKQACPFWIFGTLPDDQIYGDIKDVIADIRQLDSGEKTLTSRAGKSSAKSSGNLMVRDFCKISTYQIRAHQTYLFDWLVFRPAAN
jgi:hypothetical protein